MKNQQVAPEALRLAESLERRTTIWAEKCFAALELRRLHAENERLAALVDAQQPAPSAAAAKIEGGPPGSGGWEKHAIEMERQRDYYRQRCHTMEEHQKGGVWYWQGDDGDNLESMGNSMLVVMRADQLRSLIQPSPTPQADSAPAEAVQRIVHLRADRELRIYVAGPMTGLPEYNFPLFNATAARLRSEGWHVENPAEHGHVEGAGWADYLRWDISRIATCGAIYLLPGWSKSKGATLEVHIAGVLGLQVLLADGAEAPQADSQPAAVAGGAMDGWKLAPEEPTLHMGWAYLDAARESDPLRTHTFNHAGYRAMLAAAPTPPAQPNPLRAALLKCIAVIERTAHCNEADRLAAADEARQALATQAADSVLEDADPIRALIAEHAAVLDQNESAYFELCYHRATGWMAWITDKPLCMPPVVNPDRKVLAQGQGDTADEACRDAARKQGGVT